MKEEKDQEWLRGLKKDLENIDAAHDPGPPSQFAMMDTLKKFKAERKRAFKRELFAFMATALLILAGYITTVLKLPPAFLWIQGATFIVLPVLYFAERRQNVKQSGVAGDGE